MSQYTQSITDGINDGYYSEYTDSWIYGSQSVAIYGKNNTGLENYGAYRFTNVTVPQASVITSAYFRFCAEYSGAATVNSKIYGIDEDNTDDLTTDPSPRPRTTENTNWDIGPCTQFTEYTSPDIKDVIQEIVDRNGWVSGSALALIFQDNGTSNDNTIWAFALEGLWLTATSAYLEINFIPSPTKNTSISALAYIYKPPATMALKITKPTYQVLSETNPANLIFSSDYGTLKYFASGTTSIFIDVDGLAVAGTANFEHNLGYEPYVEVYAKRAVGDNYEYCPTIGTGASTFWTITYKVTNTHILFYAEQAGFSSNITFYIKFFIFRNKIDL